MTSKTREEQLIELGAEIKRLEAELSSKRAQFSHLLHKTGTGKLSPSAVVQSSEVARKFGGQPGTHAYDVLQAFGGDTGKIMSVSKIAAAINWRTNDVRFNSLRSLIGKLRQAGKLEWAGPGDYRLLPPKEQLVLPTTYSDPQDDDEIAEHGPDYGFYNEPEGA